MTEPATNSLHDRSDAPALPRLDDLVLSDDGHAFDRRTGRSFCVNPTGRLVLELTQAGRPRPEVIGELAARYAQHPAVAAAALETFYSQIRRYFS
ncbi:PqqD family peptide modification chaperone [Allochromatium palmeri]|uniref:PqqD family peptide modification chaperone n=1 Tax=Allochromatium palmeri TaxID=231048 RepID=A0A6N8EBD4_9GAMM|nr:PqqD family peptide modification chaperone [Allochromatium palmeri]MTW21553.1 hypothetical protein [Allochromatium palmeri]